MKLVPPDSCLKDYKKRRSAFLNELIASTPNLSVRAKEFRRWIDENSPHSDNHEALRLYADLAKEAFKSYQDFAAKMTPVK